jgi:tetratricopeptide (TPR) repeat protein
MVALDDSFLSDLEALKARARDLAGRGDAEGEVLAWRGVLDGSPGDREAHKVLAGLLSGLGRHGEAARHIRAMLQQTPEPAWLWEILARELERAGLTDEAEQAWREVLDRDPHLPSAKLSLAKLLSARGATTELATLAGLSPQEPPIQLLLAQHLEASGRPDEAIDVLDRVVARVPGAILATEALDRLTHAQRRGRPSLAVAVVGNCQAIGVAQCLRRLLPQAEVTTTVVASQTRRSEAEHLLEGCAGADLVVAQGFRDPDHPLGRAPLDGLGDRHVAIPLIAFTGFHPDVFIAPQRDAAPLFQRHQSRLIAAAFLRGVPEAEVAALFNGYVFAALGYFEEFDRAERYLLASCPDLDLSRLMPGWRDQVFVHMPKHPVIRVLHDVAAEVCRMSGFEPADAGPGPDHQALNMIWPVYPELARRLNVGGSMVFRPGKGAPPMDLDGLIAHFYAHYRRRAPDALEDQGLEEAVGILRREGA